MTRLWFNNKQRSIIIVNNRVIRYQDVFISRPMVDRIYSVYDPPPVYHEFDPLPWMECHILDTSGRRHEFRVRDEYWPKEYEQRSSGRQIVRLKSTDYPGWTASDKPACDCKGA